MRGFGLLPAHAEHGRDLPSRQRPVDERSAVAAVVPDAERRCEHGQVPGCDRFAPLLEEVPPARLPRGPPPVRPPARSPRSPARSPASGQSSRRVRAGTHLTQAGRRGGRSSTLRASARMDRRSHPCRWKASAPLKIRLRIQRPPPGGAHGGK